jgi:hypothetical protein
MFFVLIQTSSNDDLFSSKRVKKINNEMPVSGGRKTAAAFGISRLSYRN